VVVDTHVHVWEISDKYPIGPTSPTWNSYPEEPGTAEELLEEMDDHGVDWTVLVQTSWSTWDNGYIADSVQKHPDRFIGHGLIDPLDPKNAEQVRYWMEDRGLVGFRFHPNYYPDRKILVEPVNASMWEEISARDAIIQFHFRPDNADQVDEIARRYPDLVLLLDHLAYPDIEEGMGYYQPILDLSERDNVIVKLSNVAGRSGQDYPYIDVHPYIEAMLNVYGSERVMWGTGYPSHHRTKHKWPTLEQELKLIREGLPFLTEVDRERILGGTAAEVWGL
jgi:predicted TIM-barrel fold metal-dependent hydrolase